MTRASDLWPAPGIRDVGRGIELSVHEAGAGPTVVFCHGFPELAYSWRHQLPAVAAAGFRAVAPDMRGYGASSRPDDVEAYDLLQLTGDLVGLLDAIDVERAVFVGHDWGGFVAWSMPLLHPDRCLGVVGVCTPYMAFGPVDTMLELFGGDVEAFYIAWFQEPGVAEAVMDRQVELVFDRLMRRAVPPVIDHRGGLRMNPFLDLAGSEPVGEPLCPPDDLDVYVSTYDRTGFGGGINWYRNIDRNLGLVPTLGVEHLALPTLQLCATWDPALRPELADGTEALLADHERHDVDRAGHWVQQEAPDEVNGRLVDWLSRRFT